MSENRQNTEETKEKNRRTDHVLITSALTSLGVLAGIAMPARYRKIAGIAAGIVFTALYEPLMEKLFHKIDDKLDEKNRNE